MGPQGAGTRRWRGWLSVGRCGRMRGRLSDLGRSLRIWVTVTDIGGVQLVRGVGHGDCMDMRGATRRHAAV